MQKIMEAAKKQIDGLLAEKDMVSLTITIHSQLPRRIVCGNW